MKKFTLLFILCINFPAIAQESQSGITYAPGLKGDYSIKADRIEECKNAIELCKTKAENGDLESMYGIAAEEMMTPYKTQEGLKKLRYAAEKGNPKAQALLGMVLLGWEDIPSDPKQARYWWEKAAENGHVEAKKNIGKMNFYGDGGEQNYKKAVEIFNYEAVLADPEAQYYLGLATLQGHGTEKNQEKGMKLIHQAAIKNVATAQRAWGEILLMADKIEDAYLWLGQASLQKDQKALETIMIIEKTKIKDPAKIRELQQQTFGLQKELLKRNH